MKLTKQKIGAMLRKAGLEKTRTHATRIKGWHDRIAGYQVREDDRGVYVEYLQGHGAFLGQEEMARREAREFAKYTEAVAPFQTKVEDGPFTRKALRILPIE